MTFIIFLLYIVERMETFVFYCTSNQIFRFTLKVHFTTKRQKIKWTDQKSMNAKTEIRIKVVRKYEERNFYAHII